MSNKYYCVGKVTSAHGIRGELFVHLFSGRADWLEKVNVLVLSPNQEGSHSKEFVIERVRSHKKGLIFKVETVDDRNSAEEMKGFFMQLPRENLVSEPGQNIFLAELMGFTVLQNGSEVVGKVMGFSSNGVQDLLVIGGESGHHEIPLVEEFINHIDFVKKVIDMCLPAGLLELP